MKQSSSARRFAIGVTAAALVLGASATAYAEQTQPGEPAENETPKQSSIRVLSFHDLDLLAEAEVEGKRQVTLLIATDRGAAREVAGRIDDLGGTVSRRFDKLGYVLASVPTGKVLGAARLPDITAIDVDEKLQRPDPRVADSSRRAQAQAATLPGPDENTPDANPYMPTRETGATRFKRRHPTWDGRGVTIGILDAGVDLDHPALARTSTGERKIVDWVTATDPVFDGDGTWRRMDTSVTGPSFTIAGASWTSPAGEYKFNVFRENITAGSEPGGDVNRDGDTTDVWGVLYRSADNATWVDTDQDRDFTDETLMRPYRADFQVGHFGTDQPGTEEVESTPFVVEFREDVDLSPFGGSFVGTVADYVNIGLVEDMHGSHVAGIAAANDMFGGRMDGAAPGAKLVSSRGCSWGGGCTAAALATGMADLVVNRNVDVVNMSIGGLPALNDGNNARAELYDRLISDYGVQLFLSAGNSGPGLNTIGDPSVATDVVSVAASVSKATWLANYGSVVNRRQNLFNFSSRGPREDGGFKPNITAPGAAVSTSPRWLKQPDVPEAGYTLPIGYAMINGTSMASPQAAGAAALLYSAAFATDKDVTPAQLRRALYSSADFRPGIPAYGQGNGFADVNGAWATLTAGNVSNRGYTVDAPVCTPLSHLLATPDRGTGIYNRCAAADGGHRSGQLKSYDVRVRRTSGPSGNVAHEISWLGDDGTWSSQRSVRLPLNQETVIPVRARPGEGAHGAVMRLDEPRTLGVDAEVLNTVVASLTPRRPSYGTSWSDKVDRNSSKSYFVSVPEGTKALQLHLTGIATGSQTRMIAINPYGIPVDSTASTACYTDFSDVKACNPVSRAVEDPLPGVWEIEVESRRTSRTLENPYTLRTAVQSVAVTPETVEVPTVVAGEPTEVTWGLEKELAPVTVTGSGGPLGSAREARPSIAKGEVQEYEVVVPAGATKLDVVIGGTSDPSADLDLYVEFDGEVVGSSADTDSEESVTLDEPAAGTYTVVVVGYAVPSGTTLYDYRDLFFAAVLGSVSVPVAWVDLANGATGEVTGSVRAKSAPAAGRQLFGDMTVVTDEGAVVGRGNVSIGAVIPAG